MKTLKYLSVMATTLFTLNTSPSFAADPIFDAPWAQIPPEVVDLTQRAKAAITQYVRDCAPSDSAGSKVLTDNAVLEYSTEKSGLYLTFDAAYAQTCWEGAAQMNQAINSHVRIFPTSYANTVFLQFSTEDASGVEHEHLSMIEIEGTQISRIRDLTTIKSL